MMGSELLRQFIDFLLNLNFFLLLFVVVISDFPTFLVTESVNHDTCQCHANFGEHLTKRLIKQLWNETVD